jgi:hypothetical protein
MIPFACAFMNLIFFLCHHDCRKIFPENSRLSGPLTAFVKQGVRAKIGKMWVGQYFLAESLPKT